MNKIISSGIKKKFRNYEVIKDFTFEINGGSITLMSGNNGCGKTTWIKIALGLEKPDEGKIYFNGRTIDEVRNFISVVFDEPPIYPFLSGYENLIQLSDIQKINVPEIQDILEVLNLDKGLMKKKRKAFSLGQRHRLAVACALIRKPKFLILDEPAIGLDYTSWELVKKLLKKTAEDGAVVLITGHNYNMMEELCDEVIFIENGIVMEQTKLSLLLEKAIIVDIETDNLNIEKTEFNFSNIGENHYRTYLTSEKELDEMINKLKNHYHIAVNNINIEKNSLKNVYNERYK